MPAAHPAHDGHKELNRGTLQLTGFPRTQLKMLHRASPQARSSPAWGKKGGMAEKEARSGRGPSLVMRQADRKPGRKKELVMGS